MAATKVGPEAQPQQTPGSHPSSPPHRGPASDALWPDWDSGRRSARSMSPPCSRSGLRPRQASRPGGQRRGQTGQAGRQVLRWPDSRHRRRQTAAPGMPPTDSRQPRLSHAVTRCHRADRRRGRRRHDSAPVTAAEGQSRKTMRSKLHPPLHHAVVFPDGIAD